MTSIQNKWILLVEDDPNDADLTMRALSSNGARTGLTWTKDGSEALACLHRQGEFIRRRDDNPALVLLDLKMQKVDGKDLLRNIKADPALKGIPVVVFTSSNQQADVALCYELGANAYVVKPLEFHGYAAALVNIYDFWMRVNEPPIYGAVNDSSVPARRVMAA